MRGRRCAGARQGCRDANTRIRIALRQPARGNAVAVFAPFGDLPDSARMGTIQQPRILVVDDEAPILDLVRGYLEREGFEVVTAADGPAGLEAVRTGRPDVVILDVMLPGLDGIEVCRQLRSFSDAYVLMLTARSEEIDRVVGLEVGADDYLTKPFSMRELLARVHALRRRVENVRQMLAADRSPHSAPLCYAGLRLDPTAYRATLENQELDLTRTEFDLLALLMHAPGRAFSRTYLLEAVWGGSYVTGDRSVDNAILRLRKKLGDLGDAVETVWGVGYRLRPI
jgi:DNA-binding response OmpR family regulator